MHIRHISIVIGLASSVIGKLADKDIRYLDPFSTAKSKKVSAMERTPIEMILEILQHTGAIVSQYMLDALYE